jgi:ankyrin repeat protein
MARKKEQRKQETTLVPHRTPNLSVLLETAKTGDAAQAVKAYLDAGGSPVASVEARGAALKPQVQLLHSMALTNAHPHRELAESVRLMVNAEADINAKTAGPDGDERTALMCAAELRCCSTVSDVLLQAGADACLRSSRSQMTALHFAAWRGLAECCELLITRADTLLEVRDADGVTALVRTSQHGHLRTVQLLIDRGADVNAVSFYGCSALTAAAQTGNVAVVQLLLDHGADISAAADKGHNALCRAAHAGHVTMMEFLVQHGLSVHAVDSKGNTLLIIAVCARQKAAAEWLIRQGVPVNAVNETSSTALHNACGSSSGDDAAMIELLLANGADVRRHADAQITALDVAAHHGNVRCARVLLAAGADVNNTISGGYRSLHTAIIENHAAVVKLLLEHGATEVMNEIVPTKCTGGSVCCKSMTALMLCFEVDTLKVLLAAGADVHVTNDVGDTCLHVAAKHNWKAPMLCLLIKAGADLHAVNNEGKTAAQLAHDRGYIYTD